MLYDMLYDILDCPGKIGCVHTVLLNLPRILQAPPTLVGGSTYTSFTRMHDHLICLIV